MDTPGFAVIALGVVLYGLVSKRLETTIITAPMVFTGFGLLLGQSGLGLTQMEFGRGFVRGLAEVTLILVLFSDAARIDLRVLRRDHNLPVRMLLIGMPLTIVLGTAIAFLLPLGLDIWEAALLAAILAPTDAALGQSVVSSPLVPTRIRQALNVESGLNDGIALPFVLIFASLASALGIGAGQQNWFLFAALQVTLGPVAGIVIGGLGAWSIDRAASKGWMKESHEGLAILGVAFLAFAGAEIIGGNGFIAAFVGGLVFGNHVRDRCHFVFEFAEAEGQLLALLTFLIFGATVIPQAFGQATTMAVLYALLSLTVIRMAPVAVSLMGSGVHTATMGFLGWFGPRGLASVLFALFVLEQSEMAAAGQILTITIVTVTFSIVVHGITAAPLAKWYGALTEKSPASEEKKPVSHMPTRAGWPV